MKNVFFLFETMVDNYDLLCSLILTKQKQKKRNRFLIRINFSKALRAISVHT